jgi:hypothetical protein
VLEPTTENWMLQYMNYDPCPGKTSCHNQKCRLSIQWSCCSKNRGGVSWNKGHVQLNYQGLLRVEVNMASSFCFNLYTCVLSVLFIFSCHKGMTSQIKKESAWTRMRMNTWQQIRGKKLWQSRQGRQSYERTSSISILPGNDQARSTNGSSDIGVHDYSTVDYDLLLTLPKGGKLRITNGWAKSNIWQFTRDMHPTKIL